MTDEQLKSVFEQIPAPATDSVFKTEKVVKVSLPHPYCIIPKHVAVAADDFGGMLGESAIEAAERMGVRCGMNGCNLPYRKHESQVTLVIVVPVGSRDLNAVPGLHKYLLSIKDKATELGVRGFAFPSRSGQM